MASGFEGVVLKSDEDGEREETVVAKAVAMTVLFFASLVFGLLPMVLAKKFKLIKDDESASDIKNTNKVVVGLLSFGGGVLLCTTFQHLLPEVGENIMILQGNFFTLIVFCNVSMHMIDLKLCVHIEFTLFYYMNDISMVC